MYITDRKTSDHWKELKVKLESSDDELLWRKAYKDFFWGRVSSRYFEPIQQLKKSDSYLGYGFTIMTILCSLVEFIESTYKGKKYRYCNDSDLAVNEYNKSKKCFTDFLVSNSPFKESFDKSQAQEFYSSIRCGLLHEASTKNGWLIHGKSKTGKEIICFESKVIYRDDFEEAIKQSLKIYQEELIKNKSLQQAFLRKFDWLCE